MYSNYFEIVSYGSPGGRVMWRSSTFDDHVTIANVYVPMSDVNVLVYNVDVT